jgi:hypothetical protein
LSLRQSLLRAVAAITGLALALGGCTYDYLQHSDRVAYSAGDAVKANLESETSNSSSEARHKTTGLGRDGVVMEDDEDIVQP